MLHETELFFEEIWREDASLLDLVDAQFTFVNERLAAITKSRVLKAIHL